MESNPRLLDARAWSGSWCLIRINDFVSRIGRGERLLILISDPKVIDDLLRVLEAKGDLIMELTDREDYVELLIRRGEHGSPGSADHGDRPTEK